MKWVNSLAFKIISGILLIITATFGASILWIYHSQVQEEHRHHVEKDAGIIMELIRKALEEQLVIGMPLEGVQTLIDTIATEEGIKTIHITGKEGMVKLSTDRSFLNYRFEKGKEKGCIVCHKNGVVSPGVTLVSTVDYSGERIMRNVSPIENKKACQGCHSPDKRYLGMIIVDSSVSLVIAHIKTLQMELVVTFLVALSATTLFIYWFSAIYVKRPLHRLVETVKAIGGGNLQARAELKGRDELSVFGASINEMAGQLERQVEEIRAKGYEIRALNALNEIITTASKYLSLKDVLEPTLIVITRSLEALEETGGRKVKITGGIFLLNDETGELLLSTAHGVSPDSLGCKGRAASGDCICGLSAQSGEVVATSYCLADPRHTRMPSVRPEEDHAHISIPLKSGDKVLGVIFLHFSPPGYQPQPSDIATFTSIGSYLGLHIEKARLYEKVQELATHDGLTELYNHREFHRLLEQEVQRARRYPKEFSLLMMDIDHFKQFNDTYGHLSGDEALRAIGVIIRKHARSVDIAARYGGEEFAIILTDTPSKQAEEVAERLRSSVAGHTFSIKGEVASLTISIGLTSFPADSDTGEGLVKVADNALYCAKSSGRNRVYWFAEGQKK